MRDYQISAPDWMKEERFRLARHRETEELPVYALVVDKNGL